MTGAPRVGRRAALAGVASLAVLSSADHGADVWAKAPAPAVRRPAPAGAAGTGAAAEAPLGFTRASGYRLVKDWDFARTLRDADALKREFFTRYVYEEGRLDHVGDEWSRYRDEDNHEFVEGGLALVARAPNGLLPGKITSGMLRSRWTGQYGVYEIRMQVPRGRGLWPAFWLNPEDKHWPPEIDVVEIVNDRATSPDRSFHFLHGAGRGSEKPLVSELGRDGAYVPGADLSRAFHVFAVEWTPTRVRHLVDGVPVADREFRWVHDDGRDAGPAHVLVNLAVGGKWPGPPTEPSAFPARLVVSSIRIWQR